MKKGCLIGIVAILIMGLIGSCLPDASTTTPTTSSTTASETTLATQSTEVVETTEQTKDTTPSEETKSSAEETNAPTEAPTIATTAPTEPPEEMVWIPKSGAKYHQNSWCSNMKNPREVTLKYAKKHGYTACKRCH